MGAVTDVLQFNVALLQEGADIGWLLAAAKTFWYAYL
jgi:hypothetical protein